MRAGRVHCLFKGVLHRACFNYFCLFPVANVMTNSVVPDQTPRCTGSTLFIKVYVCGRAGWGVVGVGKRVYWCEGVGRLGISKF